MRERNGKREGWWGEVSAEPSASLFDPGTESRLQPVPRRLQARLKEFSHDQGNQALRRLKAGLRTGAEAKAGFVLPTARTGPWMYWELEFPRALNLMTWRMASRLQLLVSVRRISAS